MSSCRSLSNSLLFVHPGCPPFAQHAARAFFEAGILSAYVTTFAYQPDKTLGRWLRTAFGVFSGQADKELSRRRITSVPEEVVITHPFRELLRTFTSNSSLGPIAADYVWENAELWFDKNVSKNYLMKSRAVYGYEHSVFETFKTQRARGGLTIYDMPTAHHKLKSKILNEEFAAFPEVQTSYSRHVRRLDQRRQQRTDGELALADLVVCPSKFVKESLISAGTNPDTVVVVPFGAPEIESPPSAKKTKPTIFLSAGNQSIPKGTHYLLEAWRKLKPSSDYELWLVGKMALPARLLRGLPTNVVVRGSVPRAELFNIYREASVLVLPTLFEGFALVVTEAMAHGLAVITTPNSGAEGFMTHGKHGLIVPVRNSDQLAEAIDRCIRNPEEVTQMGISAAQRAAGWQWLDYRRTLGEVVSTFIGSQTTH